MAKTKKRGFSYTQRSDADMRKRKNQSSGNYDSPWKDQVTMFKVSDGTNKVRILPPTWENPTHYGYDAWVHYGIGADKGSYMCPKKMGEGDCQICELAGELRRDGDEKGADNCKPTRRVACWIINRKAPEEGPLFWSMPWTVDRDFAAVADDDESGEMLVVDHPEDGYDLSFKREGQGRNTKYGAIKIARTASPISEDEDEQDGWIDFVVDNPVPEMLNYHEEDHIRGVLAGTKDKDSDDDDDDDPEARMATRSRRTRTKDEDEDDDTPPPKPRRRRSKPDPEPDDDDGDDLDAAGDDDDKDEPEKPRKSRRRSRESLDDDDGDDDDGDDDPPAKSKRGNLRDRIKGGLKRRG